MGLSLSVAIAPNLSDRLVDELLAPLLWKHFKEGGISEIVQSATAEMQLLTSTSSARGQAVTTQPPRASRLSSCT